MSLFKQLLGLTLLAALLTLHPAFSADAKVKPKETDTPAGSKEKKQTFPVYDDLSLNSNISFQYGKPRIIIKAVVPEIKSDTDENENIIYFNQAVTEIVNDEIAKFRQRVAERATDQKKMHKSEVRNDLYIDYDSSTVTSGENHIISIRFSIQGYVAGMSHPYHYHRVLNFNLEDNVPIDLSDLFAPDANYLDFLSNYTSGMLNRNLRDKTMVSAGTAPKPENFALWNIKKNGLLITFDEYSVAPYVYGAQTVLIPYSVLKDIVAADSPVADCIKHQRGCAGDSLLTGGFIDEAVNTKHGSLNPVLG